MRRLHRPQIVDARESSRALYSFVASTTTTFALTFRQIMHWNAYWTSKLAIVSDTTIDGRFPTMAHSRYRIYPMPSRAQKSDHFCGSNLSYYLRPSTPTAGTVGVSFLPDSKTFEHDRQS